MSRHSVINHNIAYDRDEYVYLFHDQLTLVSGDTRIKATTKSLTLYHNVSPTKEREASSEAESLLDYEVECPMRLDVFKAKVAAKENAKASGQRDSLSQEEQLLVDKMVDHFVLAQYNLIGIQDLRWHLSGSCLVRGKEN